MNIRHSKFHLKEALEQLQQTISSFENGDIDEVEFETDMEHLYHHINTAWNSRNASEKDTDKCSKSDFKRWRQFPSDIDLTY